MVTKTQQADAPVAVQSVTVLDAEALEVKSSAGGIENAARYIVAQIKDDATLQVAADEINAIAAKRKLWAAKMEKIKKPQHEAWKASVALEKEVDTPYANAENIIRAGALQFNRERERIANEARIKAETEARKKADDERLRLAVVHEETGNQEEMERVLEDDQSVPADPTPDNKPAKIAGLSFPKTWKAEITDMKLFLKGVGDGVIPSTMVTPNWQDLNKVALALKDQLAWPGVKAKEVDGTARR